MKQTMLQINVGNIINMIIMITRRSCTNTKFLCTHIKKALKKFNKHHVTTNRCCLANVIDHDCDKEIDFLTTCCLPYDTVESMSE